MNKKLMALAVAGALAIPAAAFAQAGNVQIYGRANLGFDNYSATGATGGAAFDYKARNRVYDAGSRLGFSGSEDLGGGQQGGHDHDCLRRTGFSDLKHDKVGLRVGLLQR